MDVRTLDPEMPELAVMLPIATDARLGSTAAGAGAGVGSTTVCARGAGDGAGATMVSTAAGAGAAASAAGGGGDSGSLAGVLTGVEAVEGSAVRLGAGEEDVVRRTGACVWVGRVS